MMTKSHQEASCVVRLLPCVGRANARDPHTKDTVEEATGDSGRGSLRDGPSSRVAVTRDHASLPLSRKTADRTHTAAPTSSTLSTGVHESASHAVRSTRHARHELLCVRGRSVVVFRSASASPTSSLVSSARVVRPSSRVAVTRDHASLPHPAPIVGVDQKDSCSDALVSQSRKLWIFHSFMVVDVPAVRQGRPG